MTMYAFSSARKRWIQGRVADALGVCQDFGRHGVARQMTEAGSGRCSKHDTASFPMASWLALISTQLCRLLP